MTTTTKKIPMALDTQISESQDTAAEAQTREVTFPVTGMTCASCVRRIEKSLGKLEGVAQATVNLAAERATVRFDPQRVELPRLVQAVEGAGYGVGELPAERSDGATRAVDAVGD